ncbi:glycosyltransferase [Nonlabens ponticola]|uniref:Glycosyltransferase n=1 Tax=Nonlabens ponticola TaxID=2496866 RepID=A0A3S9MUH2_9FLAO|nr:glycosyltransferase [Nonlabens ponticola]AZQ42829.1 glycosyltransferase [Nonlabens ponticola]
MMFVVVVISLGYALLLLSLAMPALTYQPHPTSRKKNVGSAPIKFTIIITYRNEAAVLPRLLGSIAQVDYPADCSQWILVNDASEDNSAKIISDFKETYKHLNLKMLDRIPQSNSGKKDAITQALDQALYDNIITTDADCQLPNHWLKAYNQHYQQYADAQFIAAPVIIESDDLLTQLQASEMLSLQAISIGAFSYRQPFLSNGANMSFLKEAFYQVDGYAGNNQISSGDDIFLLEKLAAEDVIQCHYLKSDDAIVTTLPKRSLNGIIRQRVRWSKKGSKTKSMLNKLVSFQVLAMSLLWIVAPLLYLVEVITLDLWLIVWILKFFTDAIVLLIGSTALNQSGLNSWFLINHLGYPFIVIAIAFKSITAKVIWNDRVIDRQIS